MTIENLILDGQVHTLFSDNIAHVETPSSEMKMFHSSIMK